MNAAAKHSVLVWFCLGGALVPHAAAKPKPKPTLSPVVLQAHTVAVVVDPDAGMDPNAPDANRVAQKDVETALANWGRYEPVIGTATADLIVVVRRGQKHPVEQTIADPRQNGRAGVINPTDDGMVIGAQHGRPPAIANGEDPRAGSQQRTHAQTEIGSADDSFLVYEGGGENRPLEGAPLFRYDAKDGLKPHTVPAVEEFRKAVAATEKAVAAAKKP